MPCVVRSRPGDGYYCESIRTGQFRRYGQDGARMNGQYPALSEKSVLVTVGGKVHMSGTMNRKSGIIRSTRMVQINLRKEEAMALKNVLTTYISDLRMEIVDTEEHEFRENLKKEEDILKKILESLSR